MNREQNFWNRVGRLCMPMVIVVTFASVGSAGADEKSAADYQKEFASWSSKVVELDTKDTGGAVAKERELIRTLVSQGQAYLASEKIGKIAPLMEQAGALESLAKARLVRLATEAQAREAESAASQADQQAKEAEAAADAVENRYNELEAQGL